MLFWWHGFAFNFPASGSGSFVSALQNHHELADLMWIFGSIGMPPFWFGGENAVKWESNLSKCWLTARSSGLLCEMLRKERSTTQVVCISTWFLDILENERQDVKIGSLQPDHLQGSSAFWSYHKTHVFVFEPNCIIETSPLAMIDDLQINVSKPRLHVSNLLYCVDELYFEAVWLLCIAASVRSALC